MTPAQVYELVAGFLADARGRRVRGDGGEGRRRRIPRSGLELPPFQTTTSHNSLPGQPGPPGTGPVVDPIADGGDGPGNLADPGVNPPPDPGPGPGPDVPTDPVADAGADPSGTPYADIKIHAASADMLMASMGYGRTREESIVEVVSGGTPAALSSPMRNRMVEPVWMASQGAWNCGSNGANPSTFSGTPGAVLYTASEEYEDFTASVEVQLSGSLNAFYLMARAGVDKNGITGYAMRIVDDGNGVYELGVWDGAGTFTVLASTAPGVSSGRTTLTISCIGNLLDGSGGGEALGFGVSDTTYAGGKVGMAADGHTAWNARDFTATPI